MGFKEEQFVKNVDENLFCSICHEVFEDPVSCKDGHTFCKDCITTWLMTNKKCPLDNGTLEEKQLVRVLMARGIIDNLEVYCHPCTQEKPSEGVEDFEERCDWVGKLQNLTQHRETCPFQEVQCPHGCNEKIQRKKMEDHEKICEQKLVDCEECGLNLFRKDVEKHKANECSQALISCPNECTDTDNELIKSIKRIDIDDHLSKVCPKALVNCPYKEQGCVVKVERQDVEKHVQENMAGHMMLLAKECSLLRKQNTSLIDQFSALLCKDTEVKKELKSVTDQCSSLVPKITEEKKELKLLTQKNAQLNNELRQVKINLEGIKTGIPNTYLWNIHDFRSQARKRRLHYFRSPTFWLCGYCWYLQIYPYGERDNKGYMTVYLNACCNDSTHGTSMVVVPNAEIPVFFRLKVLSQKPFIPDVSYEKSEIFSFEEQVGHGWDIMETDDALSTSYCNSINGSLTIQCTIHVLAR